LPTALPTEYLSTAVALTLAARGVNIATPTSLITQPATETPGVTPSASPEITQTAISTDTPAPTLNLAQPLTSTIPIPTITLFSNNPLLPPTSTPFPTIPESRAQIVRFGELSLVTSPLGVTTRLSAGNGKVARVDLYGEDGRLLARYVRVFNTVPWTKAVFTTELAFEISAVAETGRLQVSLEDISGRIIEVNSINLILLAQGATELTPSTGVSARIVIQDPKPMILVQGGTLYVSGLVKPGSDQPLKVALLDQVGHVLGQRIASVNQPDASIHGTFFAEVPYTVPDLTDALLVVYENGGIISEYLYLTSIEVVLSP